MTLATIVSDAFAGSLTLAAIAVAGIAYYLWSVVDDRRAERRDLERRFARAAARPPVVLPPAPLPQAFVLRRGDVTFSFDRDPTARPSLFVVRDPAGDGPMVVDLDGLCDLAEQACPRPVRFRPTRLAEISTVGVSAR